MLLWYLDWTLAHILVLRAEWTKKKSAFVVLLRLEFSAYFGPSRRMEEKPFRNVPTKIGADDDNDF